MSQQDLEKLVFFAFVFFWKRSSERATDQNSAARVLTNSGKVQHSRLWVGFLWLIEQITKSSFWITQRWVASSQSTRDLLVNNETPRPLRSSETFLLSAPNSWMTQGEEVFSFYASSIWNKLPETCRSAKTLSTLIKVHFFHTSHLFLFFVLP